MLVHDRIKNVVEALVVLQMANIFDATSGKIVEYEYFFSSCDQRFGKMRSNKSCTTSYEIPHDDTSLCSWSVRIAGLGRKGRFLDVFAIAITVGVRIVAIGIVIIRSAGIDGVQNYTEEPAFHSG